MIVCTKRLRKKWTHVHVVRLAALPLPNAWLSQLVEIAHAGAGTRLGRTEGGDLARELDGERGALAELGIDIDRAAVAMYELVDDRPVPSPTSLVVKNGSQIRGSTSAGIPGPSSAIATVIVSASPLVVIVMVAGSRPESACAELVSRFMNTWLTCPA